MAGVMGPFFVERLLDDHFQRSHMETTWIIDPSYASSCLVFNTGETIIEAEASPASDVHHDKYMSSCHGRCLVVDVVHAGRVEPHCRHFSRL